MLRIYFTRSNFWCEGKHKVLSQSGVAHTNLQVSITPAVLFVIVINTDFSQQLCNGSNGKTRNTFFIPIVERWS
jgi:hypothetical protein